MQVTDDDLGRSGGGTTRPAFEKLLTAICERSARDDLWLILFSSLIILLMVGGTLVILLNLRHRMM